MQPSVHLNQKDIARLQSAIGRLMAIGETLLSRNGHGVQPPLKKRRRKRRTSGEAPKPSRRGRPPVVPPTSSSE